MSTRALLRRKFSALRFLSLSLILAVVSIIAGCGSGRMSGSSAPQFSGNTSVTVMLTSTANDQLAEFDLGFQSITLTSQSGKTVSLLSAPASGRLLGAEFMHINGTAEPLVTGSIPQDIYTSATINLGGALMVCVALGPVDGEESLSQAFYNVLPQPSIATVNFATPITVTGSSMVLSLDLLVVQSATLGDCLNVDGFSGFSITPTFNLTPLTLSSSPTNSSNGKVTGLDGQITAIGSGGNSLTISVPDVDGARPLAVASNSGTVYQGVSNFSALAVGTFLDMDGAIQSDGSLLATRIAVEDPTAADVVRGPLLEVTPSVSVFTMHAREQQGTDIPGYIAGFGDFNFTSATFAISGQLTNLGTLPFVPSFNASNMVPGQEAYISAASIPDSGYPVAATMTLMPQTINGAVSASSSSGSFTIYTVSLASYDLFPMLAVQPGQTTVENNPSEVEVYVDKNTQLLNSQPLASGSNFRFYGLVFNDNGTLRMDCAQVNDGVALTQLPSASQQNSTRRGMLQQTRHATPGGVQQIVSTIKATPQP